MKKIVLLVFIISNLSFGQFFEQSETEENHQTSQFSTDTNTIGEPDLGADSIANPNPEISIDMWLTFLITIALIFGVIYIIKTKKQFSS